MNEFKVDTLDIDMQPIIERLFSLRKHWQLRSDLYPFYTLGKSAYLDGLLPDYHNHFETDRIILENFKDLIDAILEYLSNLHNESVVLSFDLACPGFHIFESSMRFQGVSGNWHYDYPHETLKLNGTDPSTVTVAIMLPKSGAGLDWIDGNGQQQYLPYHKGCIITHDGKTPHRIAGFKEIVHNEYRISMQGHLIRRDKTLELYW